MSEEPKRRRLIRAEEFSEEVEGFFEREYPKVDGAFGAERRYRAARGAGAAVAV